MAASPEPPASKARLRDRVAAMVYEHRLDTLGRRFAAANLCPVVVKGQAVVDLAYPKSMIRLAVDVDLLVGPDAAAVCDCLLRNGYSEATKPGPSRRFSARLHGERVFLTQAPHLPRVVEVHRFLEEAILRPVDYAGILARARPSPRAGLAYPQ